MKNWKKTLWLVWFIQVISLASFGFGLPFIPLYIKELEVLTPDRVKILTSILAAIPGLSMGIMAPIWGYLADRFGRKLMIMRAMVFAVFILIGMGLVTSVNQLIVLRVMQGLFTGTVTAAMAFVAANTPEDELTYALGVITSSTFIGFSLGPVIGGFFADAYGYSTSFIIGGVLMAVGALIALIFIKEDKSTLIKTKKGEHVSIFKKYKNILVPLVIITMAILFFLRVSRSLFAPYLALYVEELLPNGNIASVTGIISGLVGFTTAFSSIFIANMAKRINIKKLITVLFACAFFVLILLTQNKVIHLALNEWLAKFTSLQIPNSLWVFTLVYMLFFLIIGGVEPLISSIAAQAIDISDRGALFGFRGLVGSMAWFIAPFIAGPVSVVYSFEGLLWVIPIVVAINFVLSIVLKTRHHSV